MNELNELMTYKGKETRVNEFRLGFGSRLSRTFSFLTLITAAGLTSYGETMMS